VVRAPDLGGWSERTPVLVDDIISSGETMRTAAAELVGRGLAKPYCVVVHALFAEGAYEALCGDAAAVVSTDTVPHASNAVAVAQLLV
jgi:ribose-phosphate pyrophosphokinase